jgi:hypothetical protein
MAGPPVRSRPRSPTSVVPGRTNGAAAARPKPTSGRSPGQRRRVIGEQHRAGGQHPEAEDGQHAEDAADAEQRARGKPHGARRRL